jgi:2-polyprenyl-6-methoxyphenol hydroxylase-like FAD-dependent oxidoreductase
VTRSRARYLDGPVAIIGGGIGGLTAALSLQLFGVPVRVFEQARALREIGAGVTVTPNAMHALDFLGVGAALAEQAGETLRYCVRSAADGRELERGPDPGSFRPEFGDREPLPAWTRGRVAMLGDAAHPMTPYLGQGACMALEDGLVLGRAFAVSQNLAEAFSRYEAARRERANGVQLAARYQGTQHHGSTASGPGSGKTAATLGLFSYNPVTEPV